MTEDYSSRGRKLNDIWRTCNKIRAATFKSEINLWDCFKECDPSKNTLISESKFISIITTNFKDFVGLSDQEIIELSDYFKVQDGRIAYAQFCGVIHCNEEHPCDNADLVTGLEWEDPMHKNRLSLSENRRLTVLLTKIAHSVRLRDVVLQPYFQDYELVSKNCGTITLAHFARVLNFLKIHVSSDEFQLLIKRFIKDSYTISYVAFLKEIEDIVRYLDSNRLINFSEDFKENFPGKVITADLPKLPRPEIGKVNISRIYGGKSFHPVFTEQKPSKNMIELIQRIKRHVLENSLRVREYFEDFDPLRCGYITKSQFIRGLDILGVSKLGRIYLSPHELENLCAKYADELDPSRVNWKLFEIDIEEVVAIRSLDKRPYVLVECPEQDTLNLSKEGLENWNQQDSKLKDFCEGTVFKIKAKIIKRQLYLQPCFKDLDRLNIGHVTNTQMRRVLSQNGIFLSDDEFNALIKRYSDDMGFNYGWFLKEADPQEYLIFAPKFEESRIPAAPANRTKAYTENRKKMKELNIVQVLAKIKGFAVRSRVRVVDFLKDYDKHNELCITETDFRRGLNLAGMRLEYMELNLICEVFKSPIRPGYVDYKRFCDTVEEVFYQNGLERAPLIVPLQHIPSYDDSNNFLNFDERKIVSEALQKLTKYPDQIANLKPIFQDFDRCNTGTVTQEQLLRVLTTRSIHDAISNKEFDVICKCFGIQKGLRTEFDYRSFLQNLKALFTNSKHYAF